MLASLVGAIAAHRLQWLEPIGLGFFDVDAALASEGLTPTDVYCDDYFAKYGALADAPIGIELNEFRKGLVCRHAPTSSDAGPPSLLDVGIGDGAFLRAIENLAWLRAYGCDINPAGIAYLIERGQLATFEAPRSFDVVTFWDSLEHIRDPRPALAAAAHVAIVSIPIFTDAADAVTSKHFRPDEHFWYFTRHAFTVFAEQEGFEVVDILATEVAIGREGIETFVLKRRAA